MQICRVAQPLLAFAPTESHRAALPQWALQKGPEAGRSSGRFVHTREVRLQGLPALCLALRLPRRDPFLPLPFLHRLVSFGDFIDSMERSNSHPRCGELWLSLVRRPRRGPPADADGSHRFRNGPFGRDVVQAPGGGRVRQVDFAAAILRTSPKREGANDPQWAPQHRARVTMKPSRL